MKKKLNLIGIGKMGYIGEGVGVQTQKFRKRKKSENTMGDPAQAATTNAFGR